MGYFLTILAEFLEITIRGVGIHLSFIVSGIFFFASSVMFAVGAYAMVIMQKAGFGTLPSVSLALLIVFLLSFIYVYFYRKLSGESFAVLTLASVLAMDAVIKSWDKLTGGVLGISGIHRPESFSSLTGLIVLGSIIFLLVIIAYSVLLKSLFGRALYGMRENNFLAQSLGVNTKKYATSVIVISSILSAVSGILCVWRIQFLDPGFISLFVLINGLTVAILAMKPKASWVVVAGLIVAILPQCLRFLPLPDSYFGQLRVIIYSIIIILVVRNVSRSFLLVKRTV